MKKNTIEIILMTIVLIILIIGLIFVVKTNYVEQDVDTNDYSYFDELDDDSENNSSTEDGSISEEDISTDIEENNNQEINSPENVE